MDSVLRITNALRALKGKEPKPATPRSGQLLDALESAAFDPQRPEPPALHVSGKTEHDFCPRKWALSDRDWGLDWSPRFTPSALRIGSVVHDATFAYYHKGQDLMDAYREYANAEIARCRRLAPGGELWEGERAELVADLTLVRGMLKGYLQWQDDVAGRDRWADTELEYLKMEKAFTIEYEGVPIAGRIDGLARTRNTGDLILVERKTCRSIDELKKSLRWDLQPKVYAAAAEILTGEPVPFVLYDMLQKSDPFAIPLLQNGLPSKAKANPTTPAAYLTVLQECMDSLGMSEAQQDATMQEYSPHLQWLLVNPVKFYERWALPIGPEEKRFALGQMRDSYHRMREDWYHIIDGTWPDEVPVKLSRFTCPNPRICKLNLVCATMNEGGPWEGILESQFVQGEGYSDETGEPDPE